MAQPIDPTRVQEDALLQASQLAQQLQELQRNPPQPRQRSTAQQRGNALAAGAIQLLNPNAQSPIAAAAATGLSALQQQRQRELQNRTALYEQQTRQLQDRLGTTKDIAGIAGDLETQRQGDERIDISRGQLDVSERGQDLREQEFLTDLQQADVERYMDPDTGRITEFKKDQFGNVLYNGKPVNPTEIGLVPYDRQLYQDTQERLAGTRGQAVNANEMKDLIFDEKFPAAVGRFDVRRRAAEALGLGQETEILTKRAKELTGNQLIADLEQMGARPSDRDLQELKKIHLSVNDDPEVWQDKYLNRIIPTYYNALSRQFGDREARERLKPLIEGIPREQIYEGVEIKPGSITDQLMNPPPQEPTGGGPIINEDNTGGTTSSGYRWKVVQPEQSGQSSQNRAR